MTSVFSPDVRICYTAAALVVHQEKVLFIKHKKIGIWFAPGGHVEPNELPHLAAERETLEETGVTVKVFDPYYSYESEQTQYLPSPFETNLHWVCQENYQRRISNPESYQPVEQWKKGCEQHMGFLYLAKPVGTIRLQENPRESEGIGWFTLAEVMQLQTAEDIRQEVRHAWEVLGWKR